MVLRQRGFGLVEVMVTLAVIGVIATIAVPSFQRYHRASQAEEADKAIERIVAGAKAYYARTASDGEAQFPESEGQPAPAATCCALHGENVCSRRKAYWKTPSWRALGFMPDGPHHFQYHWTSITPDSFELKLVADLDCDGQVSTHIARGSMVGGSFALKKTVENAGE